MWESVQVGDLEVHVRPLRDLVAHEPEDCVCGPTTEPVECEGGLYAWLIVHHALDDRE